MEGNTIAVLATVAVVGFIVWRVIKSRSNGNKRSGPGAGRSGGKGGERPEERR